MEDGVFKIIYPEEVYAVSYPVAIVIGVSWNEVNEEQRILLSKILQAVQLSLDSVRVIHQAQLDMSVWNEKPKRVIAFLAAPKGLSAYEIIQSGQTSLIFSAPLDQLQSDDTAKRKLWNALKTFFSS